MTQPDNPAAPSETRTGAGPKSDTALLVVDAQTGVLAECHDRDAVVARIAGLVQRARHDGVPVVWVQHCSDEFPEGSDAWQVTAELEPAADEVRVLKRYGDSFEETDLAARLGELGTRRLVVCGAMSDACIRCTLHGGLARGYDMTLVSDAHTTEDMRQWGSPIGPEDVIAFTTMYWTYTSAPGRRTEVATAADVDLVGQPREATDAAARSNDNSGETDETVTEVVQLVAREGSEAALEDAVRQARDLFQDSPGSLGMVLGRQVEDPTHYTLQVRWRRISDHLDTFRSSPAFPRWRELVTPHLVTPPTATHWKHVHTAF